MYRVVHFEVHAEDPDRAIAFYGEIFGWAFAPFPGPFPYWIITTGPEDARGINGGLFKREGAAPVDGAAVTAYVCTIGVDDIDSVVEKVLSAGGKRATNKMSIPGVGWLAYCKDPEGNIFGIMQPDANAK